MRDWTDDVKHLRACGRILRALHSRGLIDRHLKKTVYGQMIRALPEERARRLCALGAYRENPEARYMVEAGLRQAERSAQA